MRLVNDIMSILMFRKTKQILYLDKILLSLRIRKIIATNLLPTPRSTPPLQNIIYGILEMWWLNSCLKPSRIRDPEVIHSILGGGLLKWLGISSFCWTPTGSLSYCHLLVPFIHWEQNRANSFFCRMAHQTLEEWDQSCPHLLLSRQTFLALSHGHRKTPDLLLS